MAVTINDIASHLGISKSTVSKALNNASDVSTETKQLIMHTAVEMGYIVKKIRQCPKVCIFIENMDYQNPNQFGYGIVSGFRKMAEAENWTVDVHAVTPDFQRVNAYDFFMMREGYQASFVLGFTLLDPWMAEFHQTRFPTVLYDNYIKDNPNVASVGCDSAEGFELAVRHLVKLGHQKIGLISGPLASYILEARYQAYLAAMKKFDLEVKEDYIGLGYYVSESTKTYVPKLYEQGVTAILCSHDIRAISAMTECSDRNIRVPEDISIVGFDDLPIAAACNPPLTTVRQDRIALGKCAYYTMTSLLNDVPIGSILLRAPLIIRNSTGPVPVPRE